jgi:hypothetical protein
VANKEEAGKKEVLGFLGIGLDAQDGHRRVTRSEHFVLLGGSSQTHERMQDTVIRFDEKLKGKGKTLRETEPDEALEILRDSLDD